MSKNSNKEVILAKTSGFCFGVDRAVSMVDNLLLENKKVCMFGPVIHNPKVINNFKSRGAEIIEDISDSPKCSTLVIRAHGVTQSVMNYITSRNIDYVDTTCPFVKKIHNIVASNSSKYKNLIIAGNENHPEVVGIRSYFRGVSVVFDCAEKLKEIISNNNSFINEPTLVVAQTTFSKQEWEKSIKFMKDNFKNVSIFNTICNTTDLRQKEAEKLSKDLDLMIVLGGKESSNTNKLYSICVKNTDTFLIESYEELESINFKNYRKIGIIAGASTPHDFINQVYDYVSSK